MAYDRSTVQAILDQALTEGRSSLSALQGAEVCKAYGIPVPREGLANSSEAAVELAQSMGFPVVLKIVSPDILHKTEAGGVLVGLNGAEAVAEGYRTIVSNAKSYDPDADITGVQVQQMMTTGQEVIIGAVTDQTFGKIVAFGLGGVLVEVLKDVTSAWLRSTAPKPNPWSRASPRPRFSGVSGVPRQWTSRPWST